MFKSVIKEILIMLLLCVAIVLILGVIFYNYIPNKLAAYTTPENVKTEIEEEVEAAEKEEITYQIDGTDLKLYKATHGYTTGKTNPFSASTSVDNVENTENNTETNTNVDKNSTGTFYNNTGMK